MINNLNLDEKIAQLLCWVINDETPDQIQRVLDEVPLGAVFSFSLTKERAHEIQEAICGYTTVPIIHAGDLTNGPGMIIQKATLFPSQMACGAANDTNLVEIMGRATAVEGREAGFHWTFAPVVDLNINFRNPVTNIRAFGEKPGHIIPLIEAFVRGIQRDGLMAACAKHFPGDGVDDRDQHLCTSLNNLSEAEWMATYGRVWQAAIDAGVMSIMVGHIGLPWCDPGDGSHLGPTPATLSKRLQVDLLRNRLGFKGVIVSDAVVMVGIRSHVKRAELPVKNIQTGSDMVLFAKPTEDFQALRTAVHNGVLSEERIHEAAERILEMKRQLGMWENKEVVRSEADQETIFLQTADSIAEKAITVVRDVCQQIPVKLKPTDRILTVTNYYCGHRSKDLTVIDDELRARGYHVDHLENPLFGELETAIADYDVVFFNINVGTHGTMGTLRLTGNHAMMLWSALWIEHPNVVITSFGDPYKLWEMPSVPNMINAYDSSPSTQRAAVKVWLGEIKPVGKSPIQLPGFFEIAIPQPQPTGD